MSHLSPQIHVGYHGTTRTKAEEICRTGLLLPSSAKTEWLGTGAYFFEDGPSHAETWGHEHSDPGEEVAIIVAEIELGNCMDLFDSSWTEYLRDVHELVIARHRAAGLMLPAQNLTSRLHGMDCAMFNLACSLQDDLGNEIDTVRAQFSEGLPIFPGSAHHDRDHVQISVRSNQAIKSLAIFS